MEGSEIAPEYRLGAHKFCNRLQVADVTEDLRARRDYLPIECIDALNQLSFYRSAYFFRNTLGQVDSKRYAGRNSQWNVLRWLTFGGLRLGQRNKNEECNWKVLQLHGPMTIAQVYGSMLVRSP